MMEANTTARPRAFVSHSKEDKEVARSLATELRTLGIDAWFDDWEIQPGDSLTEKIFSEGIKDTPLFVILLSAHSTRSKWVQHELDVALIQRLKGTTRVVPVRLDRAEVPTVLLSLKWEDMGRGLDYVVNRLVDVAFGRSAKPPIGDPPAVPEAKIPELSKPASIVAAMLVKQASSDDPRKRLVSSNAFDELLLSAFEVNDAVDELEAEWLVKVHRAFTTSRFKFMGVEPNYRLWILLRGTDAIDFDPMEDIQIIANAILAKELLHCRDLMVLTRLPTYRVSNALEYLDTWGLAEIGRPLDPTCPYRARATFATRRFVDRIGS